MDAQFCRNDVRKSVWHRRGGYFWLMYLSIQESMMKRVEYILGKVQGNGHHDHLHVRLW